MSGSGIGVTRGFSAMMKSPERCGLYDARSLSISVQTSGERFATGRLMVVDGSDGGHHRLDLRMRAQPRQDFAERGLALRRGQRRRQIIVASVAEQQRLRQPQLDRDLLAQFGGVELGICVSH